MQEREETDLVSDGREGAEQRTAVDPVDCKVGEDSRGLSCSGTEDLDAHDSRQEHSLRRREGSNGACLLRNCSCELAANGIGRLGGPGVSEKSRGGAGRGTHEDVRLASENRVELELRLDKVVASTGEKSRCVLCKASEEGALPGRDRVGRRREESVAYAEVPQTAEQADDIGLRLTVRVDLGSAEEGVEDEDEVEETFRGLEDAPSGRLVEGEAAECQLTADCEEPWLVSIPLSTKSVRFSRRYASWSSGRAAAATARLVCAVRTCNGRRYQHMHLSWGTQTLTAMLMASPARAVLLILESALTMSTKAVWSTTRVRSASSIINAPSMAGSVPPSFWRSIDTATG